jgi:hypothetical protein
MLKERHTGGGVGRVEFNFKRTMPTAIDRFQNELDELDNDIIQAQVVLRRDLALLQADRQKREQAEAAERQRMLAAESSAKKQAPVKPDPPKPTVVATPEAPPPVPTPEATTTTIKPTQPIASPELKREKEESPKSMPMASATLPPAPSPVDDTPPATAQDSEFDFDAMFGDGMDDIKGDDDANNHGDGDMHMDTAGPDLNFTLDDSGPSLLRGLEDFAKTSDDEVAAAVQPSTDLDLDLSMPDVPDVPTSQPVEPQSAAKPAEPVEPAEPATSQPFTDNTNFDTMATDDLDDLFNMDYENPEATQFDDAFFGFDES